MESSQQTNIKTLRSILPKVVIIVYFFMLTVISLMIVLASVLNVSNNAGMSITAGWVGSVLFAISGIVVFSLAAEFQRFLSIKNKEEL